MRDAALYHPVAEEEAAADPVARGKSAADVAADHSAVIIATNATKKLKSVGRAYAAYFRRRAQAGGDPAGGEDDDAEVDPSVGRSAMGTG